MPAWCCDKQVVACSTDMGYACFLFNVIFPGTGTMLSAACGNEKGCRFDVLLLGLI